MNGYTAADFYRALENIAPFSLAESWDNPGLLVGSGEQPVRRALVALDATPPVIAEAKEQGAQLLITHHPVIFHKLGSVPADSPVYQAIRAGLAVLCAHTNLDVARGGVNDVLAEILTLQNTSLLEETASQPWRKVITFVPKDSLEAVYDALALSGAGRQGNYAGAAYLSPGEGRFMPLAGASPTLGEVGKLERVEEIRLEVLTPPDALGKVLSALRAAHPYEEPAIDVLETHAHRQRQGLGRVGDLPAAQSPDEFARFVMEKLRVGGLKYVPGRQAITRVAVCGGAGSKMLGTALALGAQALVTADTRHDELLDATRMGLTLIDAGHYASEAVVLPSLGDRLKKALPGAEIALSQVEGDPACYLVR